MVDVGTDSVSELVAAVAGTVASADSGIVVGSVIVSQVPPGSYKFSGDAGRVVDAARTGEVVALVDILTAARSNVQGTVAIIAFTVVTAFIVDTDAKCIDLGRGIWTFVETSTADVGINGALVDVDAAGSVIIESVSTVAFTSVATISINAGSSAAVD